MSTKEEMESRLQVLYSAAMKRVGTGERSTREEYEERKALENALEPLRHEAGEDCEMEDCQDCCDHSDATFYCCLGCGADLTESNMSAAYDRAKDFRKYGNE